MKGSQLDTHIYVVGYHLNCLDEPVYLAVSKPLLTEFGIHHRLDSCALLQQKCFFLNRNDALSYLTVCWWVRGGQRYDVEDTGNTLLSKFVWGPAKNLAVSHCAVGGQVVLEGHGTLSAGDLKLGVAGVEQPPAEKNKEDLNLRHLFLQTNR